MSQIVSHSRPCKILLGKWSNLKGKILAMHISSEKLERYQGWIEICQLCMYRKIILASTLIEMTILDIDFSKGLAGFLIALWVGISVTETLAPGVTVAENGRNIVVYVQ